MAAEKIEKIAKVQKRVKPEGPETKPNQDYFEALMNQQKQSTAKIETTNTEQVRKAPSLMDEVSQFNHNSLAVKKASPAQITEQANKIVSQIDEVKSKLNQKDLTIKPAVKTLLQRKLNHVDESLKVAMSKAGLDYKKPEQPKDFQKPIDRFLHFLTHGQYQLSRLGEHIKALSAKDGGMLQPADMLLLQIKVNYIQQEMELFTNMLNKALESTKTIMNVQV